MDVGVSPRELAGVLGRRLELIAVDPHGDGPTAVAPDARYGTEDEDVTVDLRRERNVLLAVGFDMGYGILQDAFIVPYTVNFDAGVYTVVCLNCYEANVASRFVG